MKKRFSKYLLAASFTLLCSAALSGCSAPDQITLHVLNAEDYICEGNDAYIEYDTDSDGEINLDPELGEVEAYDSILKVFEAYQRRTKHKNVRVIYDCYDTNETMLSSLKTGKSHYDLICCSDYTIQKMAGSGLIKPIDKSGVPNYYGDEETTGQASGFLRDKMKGIHASLPSGEDIVLDDYSVGYMWGTLGIVYNAEKVASEKGIPVERIHSDLRDWTKCWDPIYTGEMSIKDSMRDTYAMGIMKLFDEEIKDALGDSGLFDEDLFLLQEGTGEENYQFCMDAIESYGQVISDYFNRCDKATVDQVEKILLDLKQIVFGFEVDSGKEDIQKGLVGMNLAWSGDATYAITHARNQWNKTLSYSVPKTGGNIWFDSWTVSSDVKQEELALEFLDFLSSPAIASANQDYVGYTSFIAGEDCRYTALETHDARAHAMFAYDKKAEWYLEPDEDTPEEDYNADWGYVYNEDFKGSDFDVCIYKGEEYEGGWDQYAIDHNWHIVNLEYFFRSDEVFEDFGYNPDDEEAEPSVEFYGESPLDNPYLFFSDEEQVTYEGETFYVGGAFFAQYPPQNIVPKLAIMRDYGKENGNVLTMWENVKSNNLPFAAVIVFAIILAAAIALIGISVVTKVRFHKIKVARRKDASK